MSGNADVIVIGGGVVGLTIARRLARCGARVALFERAECGREASWAGAGILAPCNPHRSDALHQLHLRSLRAFPSFCEEVHEESGVDPEYDAAGALELLFTEQSAHIAKSDVRAAKGRETECGLPILEWRELADARRLEPAITGDLLGVVECRLTALVRNPRILAGLKIACQRAGVQIHEHTPVRDFLLNENKVVGVTTDSGEWRSRWTVLAAGCWSSSIGDRLARLLPVHPVRGQMVLMKLDEQPFRRVISRGKTYLVPRRDGHVLLGSTEEPEAGFVKRCTPQAISTLIETATRMVPSLADAPIVASWSGLRPGTPDDKPYLGPIDGFAGLIAATGHFRAGLTLAPVTAEIVAAQTENRRYDLDLSICAVGRSGRRMAPCD